VEAYGDVDELNSVLGALAASLPREWPDLLAEIHQIQSDLLHIGAWLATTPGSPLLQELKQINELTVSHLERAIDKMEGSLPSLRNFVLPGGHISAAWSHIARTVCRRAERHVIGLASGPDEIGARGRLKGVIIYLNRLSDYLFLFARHCNSLLGISEISWPK